MPQKKSRPSARPSAARSARGKARPERTLDARPDTLDFRDQMFEPSLIEVPVRIPLDEFQSIKSRFSTRGRRGPAPASVSPLLQTTSSAGARLSRIRIRQPAHALRDGPAIRRVAGRGLLRKQRPRRHEGVAQTRHLFRKALAVHRPEVARADLFPMRWADAVAGPSALTTASITKTSSRCTRPWPRSGSSTPRAPFTPGGAPWDLTDPLRVARSWRPRFRNRGVRQRGVLDSEFVGPDLGHAADWPGHLRRLARQRHGRLGRQARRAHRSQDGGIDRHRRRGSGEGSAAICSATSAPTSSA